VGENWQAEIETNSIIPRFTTASYGSDAVMPPLSSARQSLGPYLVPY